MENEIILENLKELEEKVAEEAMLDQCNLNAQYDEENLTDDDSDKDAPDSSNNYPPNMDNTLLQ